MSENFKGNRARKNFRRREQYKRTGMPRVLIVTEGEVTEVSYFSDLCNSYALKIISIEQPDEKLQKSKDKLEGISINGKNSGSAPISIFEYAKNKFLEKERNAEEKSRNRSYYWDEVYCVFDRDSHCTYNEAINKINEIQGKHSKRKFRAITSNRCFELWFLLHFKYTNKDFSNSAEVEKELKQLKIGENVFKCYTHGTRNIFKHIDGLREKAKENARKLNKAALDGVESPHTFVVELIERIEEIIELRENLGKL